MDYVELYADFLKKHIDLPNPVSVVFDCSNGMAGIVLKRFTDIPNLSINLINEISDGDFPAHGPNPLLPGTTTQVGKKVLEIGANMGVVCDGDADRAVFVDEHGEKIPAFVIASLLFKHREPPYVVDEIVFNCLSHIGFPDKKFLKTSPVGSFFIKGNLRKEKASTAAEYSGHYYFKEFFNADSALFSSIKVMSILSKEKIRLSEFKKSLSPHSIAEKNLPLKDKNWKTVSEHLENYKNKNNISIERRDGVTLDFGDRWINIRPSNTEPLLRMTAGASTQRQAEEIIDMMEKEIS